MRPLALLLPLLAVLAAGCMGGDSAAIDRSELEGLVLQPGDLPRAFDRFDEGRQQRIEQPAGRSNATRFGREGGWKARYRRAGSPSTRGPLVVVSLADVFEGSDGARDELDAHRSTPGEGLRLVDAGLELGDESFAATGTQGSGRFAVRIYLVAWRQDNATALVFANGFEGKLGLDQVVNLARKQQRRLEAAG